MVDRVALEMRSTRKRTGGSNPSLSAINSYAMDNYLDGFEGHVECLALDRNLVKADFELKGVQQSLKAILG